MEGIQEVEHEKDSAQKKRMEKTEYSGSMAEVPQHEAGRLERVEEKEKRAPGGDSGKAAQQPFRKENGALLPDYEPVFSDFPCTLGLHYQFYYRGYFPALGVCCLGLHDGNSSCISL